MGQELTVRQRRSWWATLLDLVLPAECAGCGHTGTGDVTEGLCSTCALTLTGPPVPVRQTRRLAGLPPVHALAPYREPVADIIVAQKEHNRLDLIEDVTTSRAQLAEAARAIRAVGGRPVGAAVLAATRFSGR